MIKTAIEQAIEQEEKYIQGYIQERSRLSTNTEANQAQIKYYNGQIDGKKGSILTLRGMLITEERQIKLAFTSGALQQIDTKEDGTVRHLGSEDYWLHTYKAKEEKK